ncbi:MAG TPA: PrsW family glutamic-type intramembrane protease [Lacipirellulaceae bacterium]
MSRRSRDPSIENEPHLQDRAFIADPTEAPSTQRIEREQQHASIDDVVEHTVWDEPTFSSELGGRPVEDQLTYARWLTQKQAETSHLKSWSTTLLVVLVAGPWGVLGALTGAGGSGFRLVLIVIIGPVTEEIMKVAAALWVIEKRPYLFKSLWQILLCAAAGGAAFAFIENLMYLYVYLPEHSAKMAAWRWTVCVGLHMNCSFVAGVGLARIWDNAVRERQRPQLWLGLPWFFMAMVAHGMYNGGVVIAEAAGWLEL